MEHANQDTTAAAQVVVFDFDGTVIAGQSGFLFAAYLYRQHISSLMRTIRLAWWGIRYKFHLPQRQEEARELVMGALTEMDVAQANQVMQAFYQDVIASRFRPEALLAAEQHHDMGRVVLLVSATFVPIAERAAEYLGADDFMATQMQVADGHYTTRVLGSVVEGVEKPRAVENWCNEHLGTGAWEIVDAYGDHYSDVPLLGMAQNAHAVCPGPTLVKIARQRGWEILNWSSAEAPKQSSVDSVPQHPMDSPVDESFELPKKCNQ